MAAIAARHSPCAIAAVPIANHGSTTWSIGPTPSPTGETRSPFATFSPSIETGAQSLPRRPRPENAAGDPRARGALARRGRASARCRRGESARRDVGVGLRGGGHPRLLGRRRRTRRPTRRELRDRRPELRARALLRERERRQVLARRHRPQQGVAVGRASCSRRSTRRGHVHHVDHRRRAARRRELLDDARRSRPGRCPSPPCAVSTQRPEQALLRERRAALLGEAPLRVHVGGVRRRDRGHPGRRAREQRRTRSHPIRTRAP